MFKYHKPEKKKYLLDVLGFSFFIYSISKVDFHKTQEIIFQTNLFYYLASVFLSLTVFIIRSLRWREILKIQSINLSIRDSFSIYLIGIFFGVITPGKIGEIVKIHYLKKKGFPIKESIISTIFDRLFDVLFLFIVAFFGIIYFSNLFSVKHLNVLSLMLFLLLSLILTIISRSLIYQIIKKFTSILELGYQEKLAIGFHKLDKSISRYNSIHMLKYIIYTLSSFLFYILQIKLLAASIGIKLNYTLTTAISGALSAITLIPITIMGVGTRDILLITIFENIGGNPESAIALSTLILSIWTISLLIGFYIWIKEEKS